MKIRAQTERRALWDLACLPSTQQRVWLALPHGSDLCLGNAGAGGWVCVRARVPENPLGEVWQMQVPGLHTEQI